MTPKRPRLADVDPATLIREGRLPQRTAQVCLAADLVAEWEELDRQRRAVTSTDSLADPAALINAAMDKLRQEMTAATVTFKLQALPRRRWRELSAAHPPRKNADGSVLKQDVPFGFNYEAFFDALLKESIVEPQLDLDTLDLLLSEKLTDRQWEGLTDLAWNLNRGAVNIPLSQSTSQSPTTSEQG